MTITSNSSHSFSHVLITIFGQQTHLLAQDFHMMEKKKKKKNKNGNTNLLRWFFFRAYKQNLEKEYKKSKYLHCRSNYVRE
jgi:hypothetical protein